MTRRPPALAVAKHGRGGVMKRLWRRIRKPLAQSRITKSIVASLIANALRFTYLTNVRVTERPDDDRNPDMIFLKSAPLILALWHGQHLLIPCGRPRHRQITAMVSRSADAEMNALVLKKMGFEAARGSGGRAETSGQDKGGASALIALKKTLDAGNNVAMIADIPHGTPRDAGMGIVTLARISGRPIVPIALATSRRKVLERSWDKTTINLPFGKLAAVFGEPVTVPANADAAEMERKRQEVTASLNDITARAYATVDGAA